MVRDTGPNAGGLGKVENEVYGGWAFSRVARGLQLTKGSSLN